MVVVRMCADERVFIGHSSIDYDSMMFDSAPESNAFGHNGFQ